MEYETINLNGVNLSPKAISTLSEMQDENNGILNMSIETLDNLSNKFTISLVDGNIEEKLESDVFELDMNWEEVKQILLDLVYLKDYLKALRC